MAIKKTIMPKADVEMSRPRHVEPEPKEDSGVGVVESVKSILALLHGVGPVLVGSAPNGAEVQKLVDALKDP